MARHRAAGTDALPDLRAFLGRDLRPPSKLVDWDYALPIESPIFYVIDCRTKRQLVPTRGIAFEDQVLSQAGVEKMRLLLRLATAPVAFVVSSLPMLLPGLMADGFRTQKITASVLGITVDTPLVVGEELRRERDMEHWIANRSWFTLLRLLGRLSADAPNLKALVAISGDVHFSYNMLGQLDPTHDVARRLKVQAPRTDREGKAYPYLLQLVSSGIKQQLSPVNAHRVRLLVEDDAFVKGTSFDDEVTNKLRDLRSGKLGFPGLYRRELTRGRYPFFGLQLRLGGFEGIDDRRRTLLIPNSIAVVDLTLGSGDAEFKLVEWYVTDTAAPTTRFTAQTDSGGLRMTEPRFT
jgi:hypothetical protein